MSKFVFFIAGWTLAKTSEWRGRMNVRPSIPSSGRCHSETRYASPGGANRRSDDGTIPADLERVLRDPNITIARDHEVRLADGRTLFEHMEEWRNAPSNTASGGTL